MTSAITRITIFVLVIFVASADAQRKYIAAKNPRPLPLSAAVQAGNMLFLSGTLGVKDGQPAPPAEEEARHAMEVMKHTVESAGFSMDDIVSVQIFCTDMKLYDIFNSVYSTYFHGQYPARAFIGVSNLTRGARFEVMGIAVKKEQ